MKTLVTENGTILNYDHVIKVDRGIDRLVATLPDNDFDGDGLTLTDVILFQTNKRDVIEACYVDFLGFLMEATDTVFDFRAFKNIK